MTPHLAAILDILAARAGAEEGHRLYAVLDASRRPTIRPRLKSSSQKSECLYKGAPPELEAAAPWLVDLEQGGSEFLEWVVEEGWGDSWGIFLVSPASLGQLRKHFRRFLKVLTEDGKNLYFRFSDPRVARAYLPTCTKQELDFVFGPTSRFLIEGSDPASMLEFTLDEEDGLGKEVHRFEAQEESPIATTAPTAPPEVAAILADLGVGNGGGGGTEDLERVRDALAAHPGRPELLDWLRALGARSFADACEDAKPLVGALNELKTSRFPVNDLQPLLSGFSDASWRTTFTVLSPALQGKLTNAERQDLSGGCKAVIELKELTEQAQDLRTRLREVRDLGAAAGEDQAAKAVLAALKEVQARSAAWREDDPRLEKVKTNVERLVGRLESRLSARSATSGLSSLLIGLARSSWSESAHVAKGVLAALAGTEGVDGVSLGAPSPNAAPIAAAMPRKGRYTMRRKALPFVREKLVIRDEQRQALAEAHFLELAIRLRAHVRDEHPEKWEELGEERVRDIVDLCLDKALALEIQKVPAITTLLDLMIKIDPEFTELDEFAWAAEILESDMLEANSKPELIREQWED